MTNQILKAKDDIVNFVCLVAKDQDSLSKLVSFLDEFGYEYQVSALGNPFTSSSLTFVDKEVERKTMYFIHKVPCCKMGHVFIPASQYDEPVFLDEWKDYSKCPSENLVASLLVMRSFNGLVKMNKQSKLAA
tara:strand:+ start:238 stop:633 length:396 start_codon:yes stop_codon:yes gene_type:complete